MGKKYLETKKNSLESSVLGVWQTAIEEGDARMDGRTKQYKSHRAKLEAARLRREEKKKLNREEVELDEGKMKELSRKIDVIYDKMKKDKRRGESLAPFADKFKAHVMKTMDIEKSLEKVLPDYIAGKEIVNLMKEEVELTDEELDQMTEEEIDLFELDDEMFEAAMKKKSASDRAKAKKKRDMWLKTPAGKKASKKAKIRAAKVRKGTIKVDKSKSKAAKKRAKLYAGDNMEVELGEGTWTLPKTPKQKAALKKILSKPFPAKDASDKIYDIIGDDQLADDLDDLASSDPNDDARDLVKSHMKRLGIKEEVELGEASGDKEAYKKFFDAALKKFKIKSPAELKSDEEKKKFYDYIDKNWEGDDEKAEQVKEFKIQSMKAALAKVWGMEEGHNPFAEHKGTKPHKHPHEEEEVEKKSKTDTGGKPAIVDLKPKINDK